jgi:hypothetical protein
LKTEIKTQLQPWLNGTNIFDMLGISGAEIRHSDFLVWLLEPSARPVLKDDMVKLIENGQDLTRSAGHYIGGTFLILLLNESGTTWIFSCSRNMRNGCWRGFNGSFDSDST